MRRLAGWRVRPGVAPAFGGGGAAAILAAYLAGTAPSGLAAIHGTDRNAAANTGAFETRSALRPGVLATEPAGAEAILSFRAVRGREALRRDEGDVGVCPGANTGRPAERARGTCHTRAAGCRSGRRTGQAVVSAELTLWAGVPVTAIGQPLSVAMTVRAANLGMGTAIHDPAGAGTSGTALQCLRPKYGNRS